MGFLTIFGGLFLAWYLWQWLKWRSFARWARNQGCGETPTRKNKLPWGIDTIYAVLTSPKDTDFLEDFIREQYRKMGTNTYRVHGVAQSVVTTTADPENVQAILATKFQDFSMGKVRQQNFGTLVGSGVFSADGELWMHYRALLKPQFTRDQVSDLEAAERHLEILFKALPEDIVTAWTEEVDIMPLLFNFTMDVSTEFLFGRSVDSQTRALSPDNGSSLDLQKDIDFAEAVKFSQEYISFRFRLGGLYWVVNSKKFQEACKTVKDYTDNFVQIALDADNKRVLGSGGKQKYVLLQELAAVTQDPIELRDQAIQLLVAGRDTTASLLSWVILLLSRYPSEFAHARSAVLSHFGTYDNPTADMTFSSLKACKPVTYLLFETLRLYPIVPVNGRVAIRNTTLPTGGGPDRKQPVAIMKGEQVGYPAYVMHRRHDIWGEDADEFRPARWKDKKLGWEFIGFSGGPRICLGQQYALNEASFVIARFLQKYDAIESRDINAPIQKKFSLTLSPVDVKVRLHRSSS